MIDAACGEMVCSHFLPATQVRGPGTTKWGKVTHLELVGAVHGPPSKKVVHHCGLQDFLSEGGQAGTSAVFIGRDRAWLEVERLVGVDLEDEVAFDGRNRR